MTKMAFIGLGTMGYPMAGHLASAGNTVSVYNRTSSKATSWASEYNGNAVGTLAEAVQDADAVMICAGRDADVDSLMTRDDGILANVRPGTLIIDHTTTSALLAENMAATSAQSGAIFIDAPVSGGEQGAINGQLSVMVGCHETNFEPMKALTAPYTKSIARMGEVGCGQKAKMVNQICIAGLVQGLSEGLNFAMENGLDPHQVIDVIQNGAAGSWQMTNRHKTMVADEYDHGFAIDWMRKDLGICLDQANRSGVALPVTALVDQFYAETQQMGGGRWDTSALLKRLQRFKQAPSDTEQ